MCLSEVRESLKNVQELVIKRYIDEELLDLLLELMPNVTLFKGRIGSRDQSLASAFPSLLKAREVFTMLHLTGVSFSDEDFIELLESCSESLRELRLEYCSLDLSEKSYSAISQCTKLRCLSFAGWCDDLGDSQLEKIIRNVPGLESLDLGYHSILTEASLELLSGLKRLQRFVFSDGKNFRNDAFSVLGKITTLRSLSLEYIKFDIGWMKNIASLTNLRELILDCNTSAMTPECFNIICENFFGLELLRLGNCGLLTDEEGRKFCSFTRLKRLGLSYAPGLTDVTFERGLGPPSLECLDLSFCDLTDVALAALAAHHRRLRKLSLDRCWKITSAGAVTLLRRQTHLKQLFLLQCASLTGAFLIELADMCPRLHKIDLMHSPAHDSRELETFLRRRPLVRLKDD